jgi:hypothetical protein
LGIEQLVDETVDLGDRAGAADPGSKVMALVSAMALGADCIDDCDLLRAGRTAAVLGHRVAAPSTLGTFLRAFTFGHVRQLDRVLDQALQRAWAAGAGPGDERLVIDIDSFVGEVLAGPNREPGSATPRQRGSHPLVATRADSGEVLHIRLRHGPANTARRVDRFCDELIARVDRAGATGSKLLRANSGFWSKKNLQQARSRGLAVLDRRAAAAQHPHRHRTDPRDSVDDAGRLPQDVDRRRLPRRPRRPAPRCSPRPHARSPGPAAAQLGALPLHHQPHRPIEIVEAEHRQHAVVELAIRDLKDQALAHFPSGKFSANAAWTVISALAHNLLRWTQTIGLPGTTTRTARTLRRRLLALPGRLVRSARRMTIRMPAR